MDGFRNKIATALGGIWIIASLLLRLRFGTLRRLMRVNSLFTAPRIVGNFSNMRDMFFHLDMTAASHPASILPQAPASLPDSYSFEGNSQTLNAWKAERAVTAIVVLKNGAITHEEYLSGSHAKDRRISWSMSKSLLSASFGIALADGLLTGLDDPVTDYVPALKGSAYDGVTLRHIMNMASGVAFNEDYLDYHSDINRMGRLLALGGSMDDFAAGLKARDWQPGRFRRYVSIDTHVLGMVLRRITGETIPAYMTRKLLKPLGIEVDPYYLTDSTGTAFVLGGLNMCTRDYARFGLLFANAGALNGRQIVPADWVAQSTANTAPMPAPTLTKYDAMLGYGFQWWVPPDPMPGEFFALGIYGQYIYVNRPLETAIALNGADRNFKEGAGRITHLNLAVLRTIAKASA